MINQFVRVIKQSVKHIIRNFGQSLMVVFVITAAFLVAELFIVAGVASEKVLEFFENQPQVTVFFKDEAQPDHILQIKTELEKDETVDTIAYISKEQAVEIYKSQHEDDPELLEFVTPDILPASLEISVVDISSLGSIANQFKENQFVERVIYQEDLVEELMQWTDNIRKIGFIALGVMLFIAAIILVLVIGNTISMFGHEIEVMRLVGAGSWYIRLPFLIDAVLFAILAVTLASGILYLLIPYIQDLTNEFIASVQLFPDPVGLVYELWFRTCVFGVAFTVLVSYLSVWRQLSKSK